MISLLAIGFFFLGIGIRLMITRNSLRRSEANQTTLPEPNPIFREGLSICVVGLVVLLIGFLIISGSESRIIIDTGASLTYIGILSLIQWVVLSRRGTTRDVGISAWVLSILGLILVIIYAIYKVTTL
jgi:hypothetical protein